MFKGVQKTQFDSSVNQLSPVVFELGFKTDYDEDGNEVITYPKRNLFEEVTSKLGSVDDWSLKNLLAAGISPDIKINTSSPTRLDCQDGISAFLDSFAVLEAKSSVESNKDE